jgi:hypothetical protein
MEHVPNVIGVKVTVIGNGCFPDISPCNGSILKYGWGDTISKENGIFPGVGKLHFTNIVFDTVSHKGLLLNAITLGNSTEFVTRLLLSIVMELLTIII